MDLANIKNEILYQTLLERQREVDFLLSQIHKQEILESDFVLFHNPEDCLRELMVFYFPKIDKNKATETQKKEFLLKIKELYLPALSQDLRYIDAWNNAYEAMMKYKWSLEDLNHFLLLYRRILVFHIYLIRDQLYFSNIV